MGPFPNHLCSPVSTTRNSAGIYQLGKGSIYLSHFVRQNYVLLYFTMFFFIMAITSVCDLSDV